MFYNTYTYTDRKTIKGISYYLYVYLYVYSCGSATEIPSSVRGGGIFGSRFRYSGKVQKEILDDPGPLRAGDGVIQRTPLYRSLQRNKTRSLSHSPLQLGSF